MKKIYLFLFILASTLSFAQKQKHTDRYYNSWRLGLNMGAMWQVADVRSTPGFAGGFTLEKGLCENKTNFFSLAIKGRGLWGNTYGLDYVRNYNIKNNPSLNGSYNPKVNYDTSMAGIAPYIYNNYKTKVAEGALELQICFNRLRERTNILLNLWGGIGFTSYRTRVNLLDAKNQRYNYGLVDSSGSKALALSSHNFLLDGSYESYGTNSQNGNVLTLSPSCGIGFGYRFNDYISLLWEHKITFPQGIYADYMDGIKASNNDRIGCVKDYYHYSSLTLQIKLGGGKGKTKSTTDVNNYTPVTTNTVVTTNPTTSVITNPTNTVATVVTPQKPIVNITNPPSSPYNESVNRNFPFTANVYHVNQRSQLHVTFNGVQVINYQWSGNTISFTEQLVVGNNNIVVTATNNAGSDSKSALVIYGGIPPQVNITTPQTGKISTTQNIADIYATILNVESSNYVSVSYNGQPYTAFNYNVNDKSFYMQANLNKGANTVQINATNAFGQDNKTQLIIYNPIAAPTATASKKVSVTITDPSVNPYKSSGATYKVKAKVTGVNSQSQVTVTANGNTVPFNYVGGLVDFDAMLTVGNNLMVVSASNGVSSDSKSTIITYEEPKKSTPPTVIILNPNPSPQTTSLTTYAFKAQTKNITSNSQLQVKLNGVGAGYYTFDPNTGIIDFNANLTLNSNNFFEVKATNSFGSADASAIVKQEVPVIRTKIICHKVDRINYETITINENDWATHQAHGDYDGACVVKPNDPLPDNDITICHQNLDGSKQTIVVKQSTWPQHQAHGDVMGTCPKIIVADPTDIDNDITICHKNADGSEQTIIIKQSAWAQHQAHGDVKGECPKIIPVDPGELDPNITICHKNADGTETKMVIKQSQWAMHQAHGDYLGGNCSVGTNTAASSSTVQICHNNGDGTKTTIIIPLSQYTIHRAHGDVMGECPPNNINTNTVVPTGISICHKNGDGSTTTMVITQDQWAMHRMHGDLLGACAPTQTVIPEDKKITICHIPPGNNQNPQTIEINESAWPAHEAHGDTKGACPTPTVPPVDNVITICHIPPGNNNNPQTIQINESAWPAHQAHGDTKGACPTPTVPPADKKITICHIPPGNNQNPQTIEINESAWPAHQAHGDTKGACPEQKTNPGGGKPKGLQEGEQPLNNGNSVPGRTNQSQQPQETPQQPQQQQQPQQPQQPQQEGVKLRPR